MCVSLLIRVGSFFYLASGPCRSFAEPWIKMSESSENPMIIIVIISYLPFIFLFPTTAPSAVALLLVERIWYQKRIDSAERKRGFIQVGTSVFWCPARASTSCWPNMVNRLWWPFNARVLFSSFPVTILGDPFFWQPRGNVVYNQRWRRAIGFRFDRRHGRLEYQKRWRSVPWQWWSRFGFGIVWPRGISARYWPPSRSRWMSQPENDSNIQRWLFR